ncbi:MAG: hypothetical protein HY298_25965 [Verrucomicrobia bacterium]|nr:hypothetical protein [Verrucomicrobiota bacterium]
MPSYAGRSAESWLRDVFGSTTSRKSQTAAIAAFSEMGTNGVAFLVESLERRDGALSLLYRRLFTRLPPMLRQRLTAPVDTDSLANAASLVLLNVRDSAPERTFPRLVRLLSSDHSRTRLYAAGVVQHYALNYRQFDFAPFRAELVGALRDTNDWIRIEVVIALDALNLSGPKLLPALRAALTNSNPTIRNAAQATADRLEAKNAAATRYHAP